MSVTEGARVSRLEKGIPIREAGVFDTRPGHNLKDDTQSVKFKSFAPPLTESGRTSSSDYHLTRTFLESTKQRELPLSVGKVEINGAVLQVEDESVLCELYGETALVQISLPRSLLPEDVRYGMPISLSIDETSGVRRPVIRKRVVTGSTEDQARIAALLKNL